MKKRIHLILSFSLFFLLFSSCTEQEATETGTLRICIDTGFYHTSAGLPLADVKSGAKQLAKTIISQLDMDEEDIEVELIPSNGTERKTAMTRIRTEIMSGEGPDVFLCSTVELSAHGSNQTALFPFPERAMEEGLFLPLDKYLKDAEWMEPDKMLPAAMEAGKTENGQMVLPISFSMQVTPYKAGSAELPDADTTFADIVESDNPILQSTMEYTGRYDDNLRCMFPYLFTEIADAQTGALTITEEDLYQTLKAVAGLKNPNLVELPSHFSEQLTFETYHVQYVGEDFRQGIFGSTEQVMLPLYNLDGGATAIICSFGAVNANTRRPKSAFAVLDYFLSQEMHNQSELYAFFCEQSLPVHMEMGGKHDLVDFSGGAVNPYRVRGCTALDAPAFNAYCDARAQISYARFNTALDQELMELATSSTSPSVARNEKDLRKNISDSYAKMQRLLDES